MLFEAHKKWWGDFGPRKTRHEGLDLVLYEDKNGGLQTLSSGTRVSAMYDGTVKLILQDFIGFSIFVAHQERSPEGWLLYSVYGHLKPNPNLQIGMRVQKEEVLGTIAKPRQESSLLAHLHLTLAWLNPALNTEELSWKALSSKQNAVLLDPLSLTPQSTYIVLDEGSLSTLT